MPEDWDGIISQKINRKCSRPVSRFLAKHRILTPNQVTLLSFIIGLLSPVFFILRIPVLAGLLAQISSIFDGVDGELARMTRRKTSYGGYLDSILDRYADAAIIVGMLYYSYMFEMFSFAFIFGIFAIVGSLLVSYTAARAKLAFNKSFTKGLSAYAASRDMRIFLIFIGCIFSLFYNNAIAVTLIILAVLTNLVVILRIVKRP